MLSRHELVGPEAPRGIGIHRPADGPIFRFGPDDCVPGVKRGSHAIARILVVQAAAVDFHSPRLLWTWGEVRVDDASALDAREDLTSVGPCVVLTLHPVRDRTRRHRLVEGVGIYAAANLLPAGSLRADLLHVDDKVSPESACRIDLFDHHRCKGERVKSTRLFEVATDELSAVVDVVNCRQHNRTLLIGIANTHRGRQIKRTILRLQMDVGLYRDVERLTPR